MTCVGVALEASRAHPSSAAVIIVVVVASGCGVVVVVVGLLHGQKTRACHMIVGQLESEEWPVRL